MMKLEENCFRHLNPNASAELVIPIGLVSACDMTDSRENVRKNCQLDVEWLDESMPHDGVSVVCGSGPSLKDEIDKIRELYREGATIYACNTSTRFLIDNGIYPDFQVILDPQKFMDEFMEDVDCHLLASVVDPALFKMSSNPVLWHPMIEWIENEIPNVGKKFTYIGGGITVTNSALCIAYTMGYRDIHVFGMDSSFSDEMSHATHKLEKVAEQLYVTVENNGKVYNTTYDLKQQVLVFRELYKQLEENGCTIKVYGHGLLPDMYKAN